VLLKGLDQNIFETFITTAERHPYDDYDTLQKALEAAAAKPWTLDRLRALKPGNAQAQSVFATHTPAPASAASSDSQRIAYLEASLVSLTKQLASKMVPAALGRNKRRLHACNNFAKGLACVFGDKCIFSHDPADKKYCDTHKLASYSTDECKNPRQPPATLAVTTVTQGNGHPFNGFEFTTTTRFT
jgi:hypothetical protein